MLRVLLFGATVLTLGYSTAQESSLVFKPTDNGTVVEKSIVESTKNATDQLKVPQKLTLSEPSGDIKKFFEKSIVKVPQGHIPLSEASADIKNLVVKFTVGSTENGTNQLRVVQKLTLSEPSDDIKNLVEKSIVESLKNVSDQSKVSQTRSGDYKIRPRTFDQEEKEEDLVVYFKKIQNCREATKSGIYQLRICNLKYLVQVRCENRYLRGGWIIIQQRNSGRVNFFRSWYAYKHGFGNLEGEFWYGLEKIHLLTSNYRYELIIVLENFNGKSTYIKYDHFVVGPEQTNYKLERLGVAGGESGDALLYHLGSGFSTYDRISDSQTDENCAITYHSAWWFKKCFQSNLNGRYPNLWERNSKCNTCMAWNSFHYDSPLKSTKMMIRTSQAANWED